MMTLFDSNTPTHRPFDFCYRISRRSGMSPDINSLPPSRSPLSTSPRLPRNPPTSSLEPLPHSLTTFPSPAPSIGMESNQSSASSSANNPRQTFATELPRRSSRGMSGSERRRSANLNLYNNSYGSESGGDAHHDHRSSLSHHAFRTSSPSSLAGSPVIATGDPHHQRAPSLGELHQELEQEQEAQVNRLLQMIRSQQSQLQQLQQQQPQSQASSTAVVEESDRPSAFPPFAPPPPGSRTSTQLPSSLSSHRSSRPPSQSASPSLRPLAGTEGLEGIAGTSESPVRRSSRDEGSFYQAEAAMLTRENQLLRQRIRDLERQVSELNVGARPGQSAATPSESTESADHSESAATTESSDKT